MSKKKAIWIILLGIVTVITLGYSGALSFKLYHYLVLTEKIPITSIRWSVHPFDTDSYSPQADYTFHYQGKIYEGSTVWENERYPNPWAIEGPLTALAEQERFVWVEPRNPTFSTLRKEFPYKQCVSVTLLWGLVIYFFRLRTMQLNC